jgi:hypothetical protein
MGKRRFLGAASRNHGNCIATLRTFQTQTYRFVGSLQLTIANGASDRDGHFRILALDKTELEKAPLLRADQSVFGSLLESKQLAKNETGWLGSKNKPENLTSSNRFISVELWRMGLPTLAWIEPPAGGRSFNQK